MPEAEPLPPLGDPERELALAYVRADARDRMRALWAIDENFGAIVAGTSEPVIGEMRLLWWRERFEQLGEAVPAEPLLGAVADALGDDRETAARWGAMAEGWHALLAEEVDESDLARFAEQRGAGLFGLGADILGAEAAAIVLEGGRGWALTDLAYRAGDEPLRQRALELARPHLDAATAERWPKRLRPLGMLVQLAKRDAAAPGSERRQGAPGRVLRMMRHRLTGR